ncbi:MAG: carbohydrate kinase, partial [Planctomycetes bacterium]|nr:carbohydrate kinase [Planctomycetota bacterium]
MAELYLGLDSSTQSLSAVIIDLQTQSIVVEEQVHYSSELVHYNVTDGVLINEQQPQVVHAPPLMWVEALECLLGKLKNNGVALTDVVAIAGSGQQHGSVYLNNSFIPCLQQLDPAQPLQHQLTEIFTRSTSPIWMDSSTAQECQQFAAAVGGDEALCTLTGSVAIERFTGPQIKKFADSESLAFNSTRHICLVSSFMASILSGDYIGIDHGDATGMNLLDIKNKKWDTRLLACCGEGTAEKLGVAIDPSMQQGKIASYFVQRFGFSADCKIIPWSGDNPCSLIGLGLVEEGMTAISLGTSDTCFGYMEKLPQQMSQWAHTFIAPTGAYMSLMCFKNGSLAREAVRKKYAATWEEWSAAIESTPPGNNGAFMLPWFDLEIVPKIIQAGVRLFGCEETLASEARAVVEAQMMAMAYHAAEAGLKPNAIRATGGASTNPVILQIMADVFQVPVD